MGHPSQVIEPIWGTAKVIDKYGKRRSNAVYTISSDDDNCSLSAPRTTNYGGSDILFPSLTPVERVLCLPPSTNYEGNLLGLPPSALPQDGFSTPRVSTGKIARRYIQSEENISRYAEQQGGMEEIQKVHTPIPRNSKLAIVATTKMM